MEEWFEGPSLSWVLYTKVTFDSKLKVKIVGLNFERENDLCFKN